LWDLGRLVFLMLKLRLLKVVAAYYIAGMTTNLATAVR